MKNKIYHLSNCGTCQRIMKEIGGLERFELINIKQTNIDAYTLDFVKDQMESYESIFSKRAMKYRSMGLNEMTLSEADYRKYMMEEYTFLKRPFIIFNEQVFVGNAKKNVAAAIEAING